MELGKKKKWTFKLLGHFWKELLASKFLSNNNSNNSNKIRKRKEKIRKMKIKVKNNYNNNNNKMSNCSRYFSKKKKRVLRQKMS